MNRILIVEDIAETRAWLSRMIARAFPESEIREAVDRRSGLHAAEGQPCDLVIVDLGLPDGRGEDVIAAFKAAQPEARLIVATVMGDDASIVAALSAGAEGYLLKDTPDDLFLRQIIQLQEGVAALSPAIARRIVQHFQTTAVAASPDKDLTHREREVLALIGQGARNAEAARLLGVSESTVATHIKSIYSKLGISTRAQAALKAARLGLNRD